MALGTRKRPVPASTTAAIALIAFGVVLRQALLVHTFRYFVDDAYIFFRYARSAAAGGGLVYNPGHRVMAFSSPLYTLLMTGLAVAGGAPHLAGLANIVNLALFVAASALLVKLARQGGAHLWVILPAWLLFFPFVSGAVNGMETMLFVSLQLAVLWLVVDGRMNLAAVALALVVLTRPEGALYAVVVIGAVAWLGRPAKAPVAGLAAGGALLAGWAVFAWAYYGTVVPQSIVAKGAIHGASGSPLDKLGVLALGLSTHQFTLLGARAREVAVAVGVLAGVFAVYCLARDLRRRSVWAVVPAWFLLAWLFYATTDPIQIWSWYSVPTALALWWMVARQGPDLVARVARKRAEALVVVVAVLVAVASFGLGVGKRRDSLTQGVVALRGLGQAITHFVPGARSIMLDDIGMVGWSTGLVIVDSAGLVSPIATERHGGRLLSVATIAERAMPDVICLKVDPAAGASVTDTLSRRPLFDDDRQKAELLGRYREMPAQIGDYRTCLVRRELAGLITATPIALRL